MAKRRFPIQLPALEPLEVPTISYTRYPKPYDKMVQGRIKRRLGPVLGLTEIGVNITTLMPGAASAMRHYHAADDEFIYVLDGEVTLITNIGEQLLVAGMCAGFPKGKADAHHLVNQGDRPVTFLEAGTDNAPDLVVYPDQKLYLYDDGKNEPKFSKTPPKLAKKAKAKKKH